MDKDLKKVFAKVDRATSAAVKAADEALEAIEKSGGHALLEAGYLNLKDAVKLIGEDREKYLLLTEGRFTKDNK